MATLMRNPYCRVMAAAVLAACAMLPTDPASAGALSYRAYLPVVASAPRGCLPIPEEHYETIPVEGLSPDPGVPAESHPDLNLALRGYRENGAAYRGLVDYAGSYDTFAPRLQTLFVDQRAPVMLHVYQVFQWDGQWPGVYGVYPILSPEVTLVGLASNAQEKLYAPTSPAEVFHDTVTGKHYVAMVLYAAPDRITLKYTRDDHVITGYTVES